jgi:hypothetical protein
MHYRGKLKKRMYCANVISQATPQPGSPVHCQQNSAIQTCGVVVDACPDENNHASDMRYHLLIVTDDANAKNNHLFLDPQHQVYITLSPCSNEASTHE